MEFEGFSHFNFQFFHKIPPQNPSEIWAQYPSKSGHKNSALECQHDVIKIA